MPVERPFEDNLDLIVDVLVNELHISKEDAGTLLGNVKDFMHRLVDDKDAMGLVKFLEENSSYEDVLTKERGESLGEDKHRQPRTILSYIRYLIEEGNY